MAIKCLPTRVTTNLALCGLVLLIISTCKAAQLSRAEMKKRFDRHVKTVAEFPCGPPQPRSITVEELLAGQLDTSETAQPHTTVLHRCDRGTGCCTEKSKECKVANQTEIELHFLIIDSIRNLQPTFREFRVKNHTLCSCQSIGNTIK